MSSIIGTHNLQILRGLSTNRSLLSCSSDSEIVDLWIQDDGSGRQQWEFKLIEGEVDIYNILVVGGITTDRRFLSCTSDGEIVGLWTEDDGSGRQRWRVIPVPSSPTCSTFLIRVLEGVSSNRQFLSCTSEGETVDLWPEDDGSGRQRWQIQDVWEA